MRLTDYTDYSLRVMLYLAVRGEGLATIQEISDAYGISKNHLMKVVQRLGELGWVDTVRGRNGGLRLHPDSVRLTVGEVVRATESDFALVNCFAADGDSSRGCAIEPACRLKGAFAAARDAFFAELDRHTIGALTQQAAPIAMLLGIPVVTASALASAPASASTPTSASTPASASARASASASASVSAAAPVSAPIPSDTAGSPPAALPARSS